MTGELAARWVRAVVPSWIYRWLMPVGWVAALVVSAISDTGNCSIDDPCGPDRTFSLVMIVCFASLALWWWQPTLAAAAGVLFLVLDLRYDDVAGARTAWTVYGAVCAAVLVWLVASSRRQRLLVAGVPRRQLSIPAAARPGVTARVLLASALVVVGVAALFVMRWQDQREDAHLQRAVEQTAVVERVTNDGDLVLKLPDGRTHTTTLTDDYAVGAQIPLLVDPADTDWFRPRAEPADNTWWYTVAGGAWLLALLLALRDVQMRRARPPQSWTGQGLPVQIEPAASMAFAVRSADGAVLLGFVDLELDDEESDMALAEAFDALDDEEAEAPARLRQEWEGTLRKYRGEALLIGDLAEGSWPTIVLGDQVMRPVAPFRAPRLVLWRKESVEGLSDEPDEDVPAKSEIEPARDLPQLPWVVPVRSQWWERPLWIAALVLTPAAAWLLPRWFDTYAGIAACVLGLQLVHFVGNQVFYRITTTATVVSIRSGWFERGLLWRSVKAIDVAENRVELETGDDDWVVFTVDEPQQVAGVFEALRLRSNTGLPAEAVGRRVSPVLLVDAVVLAVCVAVLLLA
ncbi:hypothetical protein E1263_12015 [Kribbella antibiotica]|uniref:Uncharacterized protein n=1 Tax=Kribbella antibiotica TaxID=190195 RepID=A0A4R4ZMV4_9ACTN|nr:hypothetical protein [Kribbella antibiotica]TDD60153.1 hypothetical protein E1263_12015 [Kribbella antibiotica]